MLLLLLAAAANAQPIDLDAPVNFTTLNESVMAGVLGSVTAEQDTLNGGFYDSDDIRVGDHAISIDQRDYYYPGKDESIVDFRNRMNATYVDFISRISQVSETNETLLLRMYGLHLHDNYVILITTHLIVVDDNATLRMLHSTIDESVFISFYNRIKAFGMEWGLTLLHFFIRRRGFNVL